MQRYHVPDMSCDHCVQAITKALQTLDPMAQVETDLPSHQVSVRSAADWQQVQQALQQAGYPSEALNT